MHGAIMRPAIVYPVKEDMQLWHVEQFGPVIPVATYNDLEEGYLYIFIHIFYSPANSV